MVVLKVNIVGVRDKRIKLEVNDTEETLELAEVVGKNLKNLF